MITDTGQSGSVCRKGEVMEANSSCFAFPFWSWLRPDVQMRSGLPTRNDRRLIGNESDGRDWWTCSRCLRRQKALDALVDPAHESRAYRPLSESHRLRNDLGSIGRDEPGDHRWSAARWSGRCRVAHRPTSACAQAALTALRGATASQRKHSLLPLQRQPALVCRACSSP